MICRILIFLLTVLGLLSIPLSEAYALSKLTGYDQDNTGFNYSSDTGPVSHSGVYNSGYADAATQTLRAYAGAKALEGEGKVSSTYASISNMLTVNPGSSGLSLGDPITLQLGISLDGDFSAGPGPQLPTTLPPPGTTWWYSESANIYHLGTVDAFASYRLIDPNKLVFDGEGWVAEKLVSFGYGADVYSSSMDWEYVNATYGASYPWWINLYDPEHNGTAEWSDSWSWNLQSNIGALLQDAMSFGCSGAANYPICGIYLPVLEPISDSDWLYKFLYAPFDTGFQTIEFQTYVGAQIQIDASMNIFPQAYTSGVYGATHAYGDFMSTFGATITSPYVTGIDLQYAVSPPPGAPIPEPSTLLIVGSGLAGLAVFRKRFKGKGS